MGERILVTGATGFVGRHLTNALCAAGHTVQTHSSAISDIGQELPDYSGTTHVFHLASRTFVPASWSETPSFYKANVQGTVNVMEFCRRNGASVTVLSSYVYGIPQYLPITEEHPLAAVNPYAHTKILAEEVARFYQRQFNLSVAIVRPFNLYGPEQDQRFLIPQVIHACLDDAVPEIKVGDLAPRRDYLHIDDLVRLLILAMGARASGIYNAGYGESVSVQELVSVIRDLSGSQKPIVCAEHRRPNEIPDVVADTGLAQTTFGWSPEVTLADGLARVILSSREKLPLSQ